MSVTLEGASQFPQSAAHKTSNHKCAWAGRAINWLNNTSSGRLLKTIGWGIAGSALAVTGIVTAIKGIAIAILGGSTFLTGGAALFFAGIILTGASTTPLIFAITSFENMTLNFQAMNRLAKAGY